MIRVSKPGVEPLTLRVSANSPERAAEIAEWQGWTVDRKATKAVEPGTSEEMLLWVRDDAKAIREELELFSRRLFWRVVWAVVVGLIIFSLISLLVQAIFRM